MDIKVTIKGFTPSDKHLIASQWQLLERNANSNFFLSWLWIGNWLDVVTGKLFITQAYHEDQLVGLGFFVEKRRKVFGCFPIKQWWLHRTGDHKQDQMWIEYNDFLLDKSCSIIVREQMMKAVVSFDLSVKEVIIGLSVSDKLHYFSNYFNKLNFLEASIVKTSGYLASLSSSTGNYLNKTLSKNTRYQNSRSTKILQSQGKLGFEVFSKPKKVSELFPKIAKLHMTIWKASNEGSGFSNPIFENFHQSIINNTDNMVQISVLTLNEEELGYLVNFVYNNKVYFYLSALQKNSDNKIKVGMTLHTEAIKYYEQQGIESYDFLGGDARYKKSLSDKKYTLEMKCYYRYELLLCLESRLKNMKMRVVEVFDKFIQS